MYSTCVSSKLCEFIFSLCLSFCHCVFVSIVRVPFRRGKDFQLVSSGRHFQSLRKVSWRWNGEKRTEITILWRALYHNLLSFVSSNKAKYEFSLIFKRTGYMSKVGKNLPRLRVMYSCRPKFTSPPPTYRLSTFHNSKFSSSFKKEF